MSASDPSTPSGSESASTHTDPLQDSGPGTARLLASLNQNGVLVVGERDELRFANEAAWMLLGFDSDATLRRAWPQVADQLHIDEWPRDPREGSAFHGRAAVKTATGSRSIRFEMHGIDAGMGRTCVVLVRDRGHLSTIDDTVLLASEAKLHRTLLAGLVHAARGPLNNFNLTLALLDHQVARSQAPDAPETLARLKRYVEVLRTETARLARGLDDIHALTEQHEPTRETMDLCAMLRECARVLRHDATLREISLDVDAPDTPVLAIGDPPLLQRAVLALTLYLLEIAQPGSCIVWRIENDAGSGATVSITASAAESSAALQHEMYRLSCTTGADFVSTVAGRLIIEAQGGAITLQNGSDRSRGFMVRMPGA